MTDKLELNGQEISVRACKELMGGAVNVGGYRADSAESGGEIVGIFKAEFPGDLLYLHVGVGEKFAGFCHPDLENVSGRR